MKILLFVAIDPAKDVDGFHPENVGKMIIGQQCISIMYTIRHHQIA